MPVFVSKFGGTSLSTGERFVNVLNIVKEHPLRRFIVVSAPGKRFKSDEKITDLLLACDKSRSRYDFEEIRMRFMRISECAGVSIKENLDECEEKILSGAGRDYAASRGEFLSAKIFSGMSGFHFLDAKDAIFFAGGGIDEKKTINALRDAFQKWEKIVMPGFYGADENGKIFLFPRGGSDTSGAIAAHALSAQTYENWTDVDGIYDKDPNIYKNARPLTFLTYDETEAVLHRGASVLHPDAVFWARKNSTPIHVRNTFRPHRPGTIIGQSLPVSP